VLGGGLVPGGVILLGGDPGIGKSTLLLQAGSALGAAHRTLYVTGEESAEQIALRAHRLGLVNAPIELLAEVQLEAIVAAINATSPEIVVIDSVQTVYTEALASAPGSVAQVRECAAQLTRLAKQRGVIVLFVGHVTKEGAIAGPRVLEHIVDTVLYFEGDPHSSFRLVRAIKNRFGAANELGVFAMTERGLKGVANPSALFLSQHAEGVAGSAVVATLEGSRPLLVEVQALVDPVQGGMPRRLAVGLDSQRLALLLAVLHRHGGVETGGFDVFVNAVGGVRILEPAADLAVLLAVCSSLRNKPLPQKTLIFGEVGLAGEIRPVQRGQERIREAAKLGFETFVIPNLNKPKQATDGTRIIAVDRVDDALAMLRE
jgi:DNA repair protein RadA/Sms